MEPKSDVESRSLMFAAGPSVPYGSRQSVVSSKACAVR